MEKLKKESAGENRIAGKGEQKRGYFLFSVIAFFFFLFLFSERRLAAEGNILWNAPWIVSVVGESLLLGTVAGCGICFLLKAPWRTGRQVQDAAWQSVWRLSSGSIRFLLSWGLILLAWLPGFLAFYPGICAYDTPIQTGQIVNGIYNDHHPILHTMLLEGFMNLGKHVFGDVNTGIGVLILLQMVFLAAVLAAWTGWLGRYPVKWYWMLGLQLLQMFYLYHIYFSISLTKDVIFSALLLLQLLFFCQMLTEKKNSLLGNWKDIGYLISTIGMVLFRGNGRYALLVLIVFQVLTVLFGRKDRKLYGRLLLDSVLGFVLGSLVLSGLFRATGAEQGDRREMLSMPIQQMARCMIYHGGVGVLPEDDNSMEEEDKALINDFILNAGYEKYTPWLADPVKSNTNTYVVRYRSKEFIETYLKLFLRYPGDFINAALAVNAGYLSPADTTHQAIYGEDKTGLAYIQIRQAEEELEPRGIYQDSKFPWLKEKLSWIANENAYEQIPVVKYLFTPGTFLWLYLLLAGFLWMNRRYYMLLPLALVLGYYGTLFLGPTVQMRYLYPLMAALPFLLCVGSMAGRSADKNTEHS